MNLLQMRHELLSFTTKDEESEGHLVSRNRSYAAYKYTKRCVEAIQDHKNEEAVKDIKKAIKKLEWLIKN